MTDKSLRIVFAGTPDFAAGHLHDLIQKGFKVIAAYSQPDRRVGRGKHLQATPVKQVAIDNNIQVLQPENLDHEAARLADLAPDVMVVVALGRSSVKKYYKSHALAVLTFMLRYYHAGVVRHPSKEPFLRETALPVFQLCKWNKGWILALY